MNTTRRRFIRNLGTAAFAVVSLSSTAKIFGQTEIVSPPAANYIRSAQNTRKAKNRFNGQMTESFAFRFSYVLPTADSQIKLIIRQPVK